MKASIVDKKTGEYVYTVEILGNPYKPDSIKESGSRLEEYKEKMDTWYEGLSGFAQLVFDEIDSKVGQHMTLIKNVIDLENYDIVKEDYPDHSKYPEYHKHTPRKHGGAFDGAVF